MQTMTRRVFGRNIAMATVMGYGSMFLSGCGRGTVIAYINAVNTAVTSILTFIGDDALAQTLSKDVARINAAVAGWTSGSITQEVIEAINIMESDLDLIPLSSTVTMLISIALVALNAVLNLSMGAVVATMKVGVTKHPIPNYQLNSQRSFALHWNSECDTAELPASVKLAVPL